ncbi:MAG: ACP S-malonyltransferase [Negativicutes bacterium]|nr:ACP S-malonyltransferase [Negativicutes bacterium]
MGKLAFVFSGQGAQKVGMAYSFYESDAEIHALFQAAEAIRPQTLHQCFFGTEEELQRTENTQPCLYLADFAAALALQKAGLQPDGAAGFSLGELSALAFAGCFTALDGFKITVERSLAMSSAAKNHPAGMAAIMKLSKSKAEELCRALPEVYPANYNSPDQLVVAGNPESLKELAVKVKQAGGLCLPLAVSGGFHSPFMSAAAEQFAAVLPAFAMQPTAYPVYANCNAQIYRDEPRDWLVRQIDHPVLWQKTIEQMSSDGFDTFVEVGVGNTLQKLIRKILPGSRVFGVETSADPARVVKEVAEHAAG